MQYLLGLSGPVRFPEPRALDLMAANQPRSARHPERRAANFRESLGNDPWIAIGVRLSRREIFAAAVPAGRALALFTFSIFPCSKRSARRSISSRQRPNYPRALELGSIARQNRSFRAVHEQFTILPRRGGMKSRVECGSTRERGGGQRRNVLLQACKTKSNIWRTLADNFSLRRKYRLCINIIGVSRVFRVDGRIINSRIRPVTTS